MLHVLITFHAVPFPCCCVFTNVWAAMQGEDGKHAGAAAREGSDSGSQASPAATLPAASGKVDLLHERCIPSTYD